MNGKVFFRTQKNHGLFESADKVRIYTKKEDIAEQTGNPVQPASSSSSMLKKDKRSKSIKKNNPNQIRSKDVQSVGDEYEGYKVNARVVYFVENPDPYIHGTLKFLGYLNKFNGKVYAVVETVRV